MDKEKSLLKLEYT